MPIHPNFSAEVRPGVARDSEIADMLSLENLFLID
jgi:hypothetical protein